MEGGLGGREEGAGTMWCRDKRTERPLMGPRLEEGKAKAGLSQCRAVPGTESFTKWQTSSL